MTSDRAAFEIELTLEMVAAGATALSHYTNEFESYPEGALAIFKAMLEKSRDVKLKALEFDILRE